MMIETLQVEIMPPSEFKNKFQPNSVVGWSCFIIDLMIFWRCWLALSKDPNIAHNRLTYPVFFFCLLCILIQFPLWSKILKFKSPTPNPQLTKSPIIEQAQTTVLPPLTVLSQPKSRFPTWTIIAATAILWTIFFWCPIPDMGPITFNYLFCALWLSIASALGLYHDHRSYQLRIEDGKIIRQCMFAGMKRTKTWAVQDIELIKLIPQNMAGTEYQAKIIRYHKPEKVLLPSLSREQLSWFTQLSAFGIMDKQRVNNP